MTKVANRIIKLQSLLSSIYNETFEQTEQPRTASSGTYRTGEVSAMEEVRQAEI